MDSVWVHMEGTSNPIQITGRRIKNKLLGYVDLDTDICEAIIQSLREQELTEASRILNLRPRHFVCPEWGVSITITFTVTSVRPMHTV